MNPIHILLVEDNEGDILMTTEAFGEARTLSQLSVVRDGNQAVEFLTRQGEYTNAKLPDIMLLDINLPKKNGHEVLQFVKSHDSLKKIPVIILTTSSSEADIARSYQLHANCYITKPVEVDNFIDMITKIEGFWISIVSLPRLN